MNQTDEKEIEVNNDIPEIVMRVLREDRTEEEMQLFLQWYGLSQENKMLYFQLKHLYDSRKGGLKPDDHEVRASWERLSRKLNRDPFSFISPGKHPAKPYRRIARYAGVAATVLLLMVSGIYLFILQSNATVWTEVSTLVRSAPQTVQLSDGSMVQLNASSTLRYPVKFGKKNREVYLDGEAFFTVAKDKHRPFIVHNDKQAITVLGTQFNVLGYSSDPFTVTTLVTGKIKLGLFDSENNPISEMEMQPRDQLIFDKVTGETTLSVVDTGDATSWLDGIYAFKDTPLMDITRRLEKVYGITIQIPDETYRNERYNGTFFSNQSIEEIVEILNFKEEFVARFNNDTLILQTNRE